MKTIRVFALVFGLLSIVSAEITIHIYNPWIEDPYRQDSIFVIGNNEVGYYPGTKMTVEGNGWFSYTFTVLTASDNIKFCSYVGNQYDKYAKKLEFTNDTSRISLATLRVKFPGGNEFWIIPVNATTKFNIYDVPPNGKTIHLFNPWPDNSPQIIVGGNPPKKMIVNTTKCGWYSYFFAGFIDSLKNVLFTDYYHKYQYGLNGMSGGTKLDLTKYLSTNDTIYILPKPFPNGLPSISTTFPGKTGECPTRKVSAIIRDWHADDSSFNLGVSGGKLVTGMVTNTLGVNGKPVKGPNADAGRGKYLESWFVSQPNNYNQTCVDLTLTKGYDGRWEYDSDFFGGFFPVDNFADPPNNKTYEDAYKKMHNFLFTMEMHMQFIYRKGSKQEFIFQGDDDVWIFVNGKLAIDLGGLHEKLADTLYMDVEAAKLGLADGGNYNMDIFYAERQPVSANFLVRTSLDLHNSEDLFYKEKPLGTGKTQYDILQQIKVEGNDCGFTPIQNEVEPAIVDFYLGGVQFGDENVPILPGISYGGITVDNSKSFVTIDSAAIKGLSPGVYTITFISSLNKERSGYLTFKVGGKEPATLTADPIDGTHFFDSTKISLFTNEDAKIYYTTDGSKPDTNNVSQIYTGAFKIDKSLTVKAIAIGENYVATSASWSYVRDLPDAKLEAIPGNNTHFGESLQITLKTDAEAIYYTTDGSEPLPGNNAQRYIVPFTVTSAAVTVKAIAVGTYFNSTKGQWRYISDRIPDIFAIPPGCEFTKPLEVNLMVSDSDATIYYTTDGSEPTINSTRYQGSIKIDVTTVIKARAFANNKVPSALLTETYTRSSIAINAKYLDKNADGSIDSFWANLDYPASSLPDSLILQNPHKTSEKIILRSDQIKLSDDKLEISALIVPPFSYDNNTGFFAGTYVRFGSKGYVKDGFFVNDGVAPLISQITFSPEILSDNNPNGLGILLVTFSEDIKVISGQQPFAFYQNGTPYTLDLTLLSQAGNKATFRVNNIQGADFPEEGDLASISVTGIITDMMDNVQNNPENRRVPLKVNPQEYSLLFSVYPNPFVPGNSKINVPISGLSITDGVSIVADFRGNLKSKSDKIKAQIVIYDNVGNIVCKADAPGGTGSPVQFGIVQQQRTKVVFLWNGHNRSNRKVASGTYLAILTITDPYNRNIMQRVIVGVKN